MLGRPGCPNEGGDMSEGMAPAATVDQDAQRKILNRLRRAHGQLGAVITAVEAEASCRDVVQQLSAVAKALDRAGFLVISTSLRECLSDPDADTSTQTEELERLFLSLA